MVVDRKPQELPLHRIDLGEVGRDEVIAAALAGQHLKTAYESPRRTCAAEMARCTCGYGFTFRGGSIADPMVPNVTRVFSWGPFFEREAKRLEGEGLSVRRIAIIMKVNWEVARRLVRGKRNKFEPGQRETPALRAKWLRTRSRCV